VYECTCVSMYAIFMYISETGFVCPYTYVYAYIRIRIRAHNTYVCMHAYMHVCMHICMHACTYVCKYRYISNESATLFEKYISQTELVMIEYHVWISQICHVSISHIYPYDYRLGASYTIHMYIHIRRTSHLPLVFGQ